MKAFLAADGPRQYPRYRQCRHYAEKHGRDKELSRVILLTPNERLSGQHEVDLHNSNIPVSNFAQQGHNLCERFFYKTEEKSFLIIPDRYVQRRNIWYKVSDIYQME